MSKNYKEKITMKFNKGQLDRTIVGLLNYGYNKKFAHNVERLFDLFVEESYKNEYEKELRVYVISKLTDIVINKNIVDKGSILAFVDFSGRHEDAAQEVMNNLFEMTMEESELENIDRTISEQLRFSIIGNQSIDLGDMINNYQTENYENLPEFIEEFATKIDEISKDLRRARESVENAKEDLSLGNSNFVNLLDSMITKARNPSAKVRTGIRMLNEAFSGGYEKGRVYLALGLAKGWKSGFLLNSALWAVKYNEFITKDPNKRPVVVYLTMENTIEETIERIWSHFFGNDSEFHHYESSVAARMLEEQKIFTPNNPELPELIIWHRNTKTINTLDMSAMLDDLEKDGKECVFLVQDYIKRIRSSVNHKEIRFELSIVSDEFKNVAKEHEIPILTAMQLNREAFRDYEASTTMEGQISAVEKMGASNVGESIDLIQNVDYAFILGRTGTEQLNDMDEVEYTDRFLIFKLIAARGKNPKVRSFKHRFKDGNDMSLIEDLNLARSVSVSTVQDLLKEKVTVAGHQKSHGRRIE